MAAEISVQDPSGSTTRPGGGLGVPLPSLHNIKENEVPASMFDVYETYARILNNEDVSSYILSGLDSLIVVVDANATSCRTSTHGANRTFKWWVRRHAIL